MRVGVCLKCGNVNRQFINRCYTCNEAKFKFVDMYDSAKIKAVQCEVSGQRQPGSEFKALMVVALVVSGVVFLNMYLTHDHQAAQQTTPQALSTLDRPTQ